MSSIYLDPVAVFDHSFPLLLQKEMVELLRELYGFSLGMSESIARGPHHRDLHPHIRRALIESKLEQLVAGYEAITARIETNRSGNTHVVIEGKNIILTESFARSPTKGVRWAAYRSADSLQNFPLFQKAEPPDELRPDMKFNAVFLHGQRSRGKNELGFALIRFPRPGFKSYLPDLINLLDRFSVAPFAPQAEGMEEIPDAIEPKVLTDRPIRKDS